MNTSQTTTIRASWRNDWAAVRSHSPLFFESPTFSVAVRSLEMRDSRIARMMNKPVPHSTDAYWIVNARCGQYALNAMRRASHG